MTCSVAEAFRFCGLTSERFGSAVVVDVVVGLAICFVPEGRFVREVTGFEAGAFAGGLIDEDSEEVDTRFVSRGTPLEGFGIAAGAGCNVDVDAVFLEDR